MNISSEHLLKQHVLTSIRAAGLNMTPNKETIVFNTLMPKVRGIVVSDRKRKDLGQLPEDPSDLKLTRMEHIVLLYGARGWTAGEAADYLGLSADTIKSHRLHMYRKMGTSSMSRAVAYAIHHGIITMDAIENVHE